MIPAWKSLLTCVLLILGATATCPRAHAVVLEMKTRNGIQIMCMQTGLIGGWEECGTQDYVTVFRGKVVKVVQVSEWDLDVSVAVEEVFKGDLKATVEFGTSQGICFDDLSEGSEWLFFLEKDEKTGAPFLNYYSRNPSGPIEAKGDVLARLRKLELLHGEGMIIGSVRRDSHRRRSGNSSPVSGYTVVARDSRTGKEYSTMTDSKGNFEIDSIPSGSFSLTPSRSAIFPELKVRSSKFTINVAPGGCSAVDLAAEE